MPETVTPVILPGEKEICLSLPNGESLRGYFHDNGSDPVGIYLHGFRSNSSGEKSIAIAQHAISEKRSWLRFDLRGHGISDGELRNQVISSGLADLLCVIDSLPQRQLILHGSSMGGWISLLASLRRKSQIAGMMLIAPAFNYVQKKLTSLPDAIKEQWRKETYMTFPDAYGNEPYSLRYDIMQDAEQFDVMDLGINIDFPVHIVHGENDPIIPITDTEDFIRSARLTKLTYERVPGGEHRLTEHTSLINRHIDALWQEIKN